MGEPDVPSVLNDANDEEESTCVGEDEGSESTERRGQGEGSGRAGAGPRVRVERERPSTGLSEVDLFGDIVDVGSSGEVPVDGSLGSLAGTHQPAEIATMELHTDELQAAVEDSRKAAGPRAHASTRPRPAAAKRLSPSWIIAGGLALLALAGALYFWWMK